MKTTNCLLYKIDLSTETVQDVSLFFEFREVVFIKWTEDFLCICIEEY